MIELQRFIEVYKTKNRSIEVIAVKDSLSVMTVYREKCSWMEYQLVEYSGLPQLTISS